MSTATPPRLAHLVFFTLTDRSSASVDAFVGLCREHLSDHPGTVHFSAGPRGESYTRPVNDQEFDVALVLVFQSEADHDAYQVSPRHKQFLAEASQRWAKVRVFDALV
jgi:hypothetical protein